MPMRQAQPSRPAMRIPLADLRAQHQQLGRDLQEAIDRVFAASDFVLGKEVRQFEEEYAAYCGTTEAIACANGTDALELALWAIGVGPGDDVITVANTFAAMDGSRLESPYHFTFRVRGPRLLTGSPVSGQRHPKFITPTTRSMRCGGMPDPVQAPPAVVLEEVTNGYVP